MANKNFVSEKDISVPLFNNVLDHFTRTHWSIPLIVFVPFIIYCLFVSVTTTGIGWVIIPVFIGGFLFWTLAEYILHRFVFHQELPGKLGRKIHFIVHGVHHDYPNDSTRLVMPPILSIPLTVLFYYLFTAVLPAIYVLPFLAAFLTGYLIYDMMHYALHHVRFKNPYWQKLKAHHMLHHFDNPDKDFGVSSTFWDRIFRSKRNA